MKYTTKHPRESKARKRALKEAGITYQQVADRANVTWRMVKFWVDCQKTSSVVERAYYELLAEAKKAAAA